jgi:hypothetical protein
MIDYEIPQNNIPAAAAPTSEHAGNGLHHFVLPGRRYLDRPRNPTIRIQPRQ